MLYCPNMKAKFFNFFLALSIINYNNTIYIKLIVYKININEFIFKFIFKNSIRNRQNFIDINSLTKTCNRL